MKVLYTVPSSQNRVSYAGNGSTTGFPVPYVFFDNTDLIVTSVVVATGVETVKTLTTDYTVSGGDGSTGTVTAVTAPATGTTWVIERSIPYTQEIDYQPNDGFPADVNEEGLDRNTMLAQQTYRRARQSPKLPVTYDPENDDPVTFPLPESGKLLAGNTDETGFENVEVSSISTADIPALISGLANRDLLEYDSGGAVWKNQLLATVLGRMLTTRGDDIRRGASGVERLALGTLQQLLFSDGTDKKWGSLSLASQFFTANGTYTPTAGMFIGVAIGVGGGGGGGGIAGDVGWASEAAGGGSGGWSIKLITKAAIGTSKAVVAGAAGAGGTAGANNGTAGSDTTLGSTILVAKGGSGGQYSDAGVQVGTGGAGGIAGTGDVALPGRAGFSGQVTNSTAVTARGGKGADSIFGAGGIEVVRSAAGAVAGNAATGYGAGGAGGASLDSAGTAAGGAGTIGALLIFELCLAA
jgi:hypothetical protein